MLRTASCLLALIVLLSGCSPADSGNGVAAHPILNSQVMVTAYALVQSPSESAKAAYSVNCALRYTSQGKSNSDFNSATVTVNGLSLGRSSDGVFVNTESMQFSEGDSLEFVIKHSEVGTIKQVLLVPQPVQDYSVFPGLPADNSANTNTKFFISWEPIGATFYYLISDCYNSREVFMTENWSYTMADSVTVVLEDSTSQAYPFLQLRLLSYNAVSLSGFADGSAFYVSSSYYKVHSNL